MSASADPSIRSALSGLLAGHFLAHLEAESRKERGLLDHITTEGVPYRQIVNTTVERVRREFPAAPVAPYNLFERWVAARDVPSYAATTFKLYNYSFLDRLLDLRDGSTESEAQLRRRIATMLATGKFYGRGFTFKRFFQAENYMREELGRALAHTPEIPYDVAYGLILAQSEVWAEAGYDYYDRVLRGALGQSNRLLRNILPRRVAGDLITNGKTEPAYFESVAVLFTDFVGFTRSAQDLSAAELVRELDDCFTRFDQIAARFRLEKIKTIGDAYMAAGGLPRANRTHAVDAVLAALAIQASMRAPDSSGNANSRAWRIRVGIHCGPVVAGVIGRRKFAYDIWGDTVNTASRMESAGEPGRINISAEMAARVRDFFELEERGPVEVRGKGALPMYFVRGLRPELALDGAPGPAFRALYRAL